ncbi:MAG: hypothetical protein B1H03_01945 [Planctomycetales bacterium 4484_113]|nr:MAG: hypothetical protein B1H03_01945 [Planctomycetales bacterium 4484_113]
MLVVQYDGTEFYGSQVQPSVRTVQGTLTEAIGQILGRKPRLLFASRTDRGVHATHNVCAFKAEGMPMPLSQFLDALNDRMPSDLVVVSAREVPAKFHPRYLAVRRDYVYRIWQGKREDIRYRRFAAHWPGTLDLASMRLGAMMLRGRHDFSAFALASSKIEDPKCNLSEIRLKSYGKLLRAEFRADRFLRRMVCFLVGALVDVGSGHRWLDEIGQALGGDTAMRRFTNMPSRGLTLTGVHYPEHFFSEGFADRFGAGRREAPAEVESETVAGDSSAAKPAKNR